MLPIEYRLDDIGRQESEWQDTAHITFVDAVAICEFLMLRISPDGIDTLTAAVSMNLR